MTAFNHQGGKLALLLALTSFSSLTPCANARECDGTLKRFAAQCCPVTNPVFQTFCDTLLRSAPAPQKEEEAQPEEQQVTTFSDSGYFPLNVQAKQENSTEEAIDPPPQEEDKTEEVSTVLEDKIEISFDQDQLIATPITWDMAEEEDREDEGTADTIEVEAPEEATTDPVPTWSPTESIPPTESPPTECPSNSPSFAAQKDSGATTGKDGCDPMERAFAPDCCPVKDPSYAEFCESLLGRPAYVSNGMVSQHEKWIGGYGVAYDPNDRRRRQ